MSATIFPNGSKGQFADGSRKSIGQLAPADKTGRSQQGRTLREVLGTAAHASDKFTGIRLVRDT